MGARKEEYIRVVPHNSVIHVDDFESPKHLAEYLHQLDQNDTLYNDYFRWKGSGFFLNTRFYCRLCAMLHNGSRRTWYDNTQQWWGGPGVCIRPNEQNPWGSWKKVAKMEFDASYNPLVTSPFKIPDLFTANVVRQNCTL